MMRHNKSLKRDAAKGDAP